MDSNDADKQYLADMFPKITSKYLSTHEFQNSTFIKKDVFSLCHFNAVSLNANKLDLINELLCPIEKQIDILAFSETKWNCNTSHNLKLNNYHPPERIDSLSHSGGIVVYIKNSYDYKIRHDIGFNLDRCENLWIEILLPKPIIIGIIYRHPGGNLESLM